MAVFTLVWLVIAVSTVGIGLLLAIPYYFLVFHGADARAKKADEKMQSTLMKGESVTAKGLQRRPFALWSRRQMIAITSSRIVLVSRSLLGGFSMKDYQWKDLHDAKLAENVLPNFFGSHLSFETKGGSASITIDGLDSPIASQIYSHAQAQEQEWEEKNRIRSLEEKRAAAGGVVVHAGAGSGGAAPAKDDNSVFEGLEKAKKLLDAGAISDAEYQEMKSKILARGL